jgi:hypothetical protein
MEFALNTAEYQRLMTPARRKPEREFLFFPPAPRVPTTREQGASVDANVWLVAIVRMGLAPFASIIFIRIGISVALIEIAAGILAGNLPRPTAYEERGSAC